MEYRILSAEPEQFQAMLDFIFSKLRGNSPSFSTIVHAERRMGESDNENLDVEGVDHKLAYELRLVCEEVFINIVSYAYPHRHGDVHVGCDRMDGRLVIQLIDAGIPFNPLVSSEPDLSSDIEFRDIGGLGIFLVKNLMDKITYERVDDRNILTMEKQVQQ